MPIGSLNVFLLPCSPSCTVPQCLAAAFSLTLEMQVQLKLIKITHLQSSPAVTRCRWMLHQSTARTTAPALAALSSNANHFIGLVMALSVGSTQMFGPTAYATCEDVSSTISYACVYK